MATTLHPLVLGAVVKGNVRKTSVNAIWPFLCNFSYILSCLFSTAHIFCVCLQVYVI